MTTVFTTVSAFQQYHFYFFAFKQYNSRGKRWRSWLRHCTTSREVSGSIPDGVIWIFHWRNPSDRTMALGSTQPLTEMSTRNIHWEAKAAGAYGWQPYHLHVPTVLKSGSLSLLEPLGPVQSFIIFFRPNATTCSYELCWSPLLAVAEV